MVSKKRTSDAASRELRALGLTYPGAHLKSPWPGHADLAVADKTFAYLSAEGEPFSISCKLPRSAALALSLPFSVPTAYGLGKSGWVTATFEKGDIIPVAMFKEWIDESYRAQAPKKFVAMLPGGAKPLVVAKAPAKKRSAEARGTLGRDKKVVSKKLGALKGKSGRSRSR